jgi:hypothetical protein
MIAGCLSRQFSTDAGVRDSGLSGWCAGEGGLSIPSSSVSDWESAMEASMESTSELPEELVGSKPSPVSLGEFDGALEELPGEVVEVGRFRADACDSARCRLCMIDA